ncbi:hypothetical protein KEM54_002142 [Ascosphaera aggregata]|nr:hypothetical protein KEM54_002142 [Ascosphaera aggregata]
MAYWWTISSFLTGIATIFQYQILKKCPPRSVERTLLSSFVFVPAILASSCLQQVELKKVVPDVTLVATVGYAPLFYAFERLFALDLTLTDDDYGRIKKDDDDTQPMLEKAHRELRRFYDTFTNFRRIHHADQAKNIPRFSQWPLYPSKLQFLAFRCLRTAVLYVLMDIIGSTRDDTIDMDAWSLSRLWQNGFPRRDICFAVICAILYWFNAYLILTIQYDVMSMIVVMLNFDDPPDWPPLFGSIGQAYTLRKFWGTFWHQLLRHMLETNSAFIAHSLLGIPKMQKDEAQSVRLTRRYTKLVLTFIVSGLFHLGSDVSIGVPFSQSRAVAFFMIQSAGIILEDSVEAVWSKFLGSNKTHNDISPWKKALGYVWVTMFMALTVPMWSIQIAKATSRLPIVPTRAQAGSLNAGQAYMPDVTK